MGLQAIRALRPEQFIDVPMSQEEFEHLINVTEAGQIYLGEPTAGVPHFTLNSGAHSACYLNCSLLLAETNICSIMAQQLIKACGVATGDVEWVIGSAMASVSLAHEVARQLRCRAGYVEKGSGKKLESFRFVISEGERVLIINELMATAGGTTWDTKRLVQENTPFPVEFLPMVGVMVNRSKDDILQDGTPVRDLYRFLNLPTFGAGCPFCAAGSPMIHGGKKEWSRAMAMKKK